MTKKEKRLWLDTVTLAEMSEDLLDCLQAYIDRGYRLVIANTILDVKAFQDNYDWIGDRLEAGEIVIEIWATPDEMVKKPFHWSSVGIETPASDSFEKAIAKFPNKSEIFSLQYLLNAYGIQKGEWPMGQWAPPEPLSAEAQEVLGLTEAATRTEVLDACKRLGRMDLFDAYNVGYNRGLARQHTCEFILNTDGTVTRI